MGNKGLSLEYDIVNEIGLVERFIRDMVKKTRVGGVVLGLSGGLDSSVLAALCARALGPERVQAMIMPMRGITPPNDAKDAKTLAEILGIRYTQVELAKIIRAFLDAKPLSDPATPLAKGNIMARIRMINLYYVANLRNYLVAGSGDRSEILIGYFTKHGDGGADFFPIGNLYKTQVRELAKYLELPASIVNKQSSPRFWKGHVAENEIGLEYGKIDLILHGIMDLNLKPEEVASQTNVSFGDIKKILKMIQCSEHKRIMPPTPPIDYDLRE
jgi:NAD+ synthase